VANKNSPTSKPVHKASIPSKFSPAYVAFVTHTLPPEKIAQIRDVNPVAVIAGVEAVVQRGYRLSVERRPDGYFQAALYGIDTGTAEDDGLGISGGGQSPLLAIACVLLKLNDLGILNLRFTGTPPERDVAW